MRSSSLVVKLPTYKHDTEDISTEKKHPNQKYPKKQNNDKKTTKNKIQRCYACYLPRPLLSSQRFYNQKDLTFLIIKVCGLEADI